VDSRVCPRASPPKKRAARPQGLHRRAPVQYTGAVQARATASTGSAPTGSFRLSKRPSYRICLTERSSIVDRGERLDVWLVRVGDAWVRVSEHPAARVEVETNDEHEPHAPNEPCPPSEPCPPGTIWLRRTQLVLEGGTRLMQRQSWPRHRSLSVMGYLMQGISRPQRMVQEREFVVIGNYRLAPVGNLSRQTETGRAPEAREEHGAGSSHFTSRPHFTSRLPK
jgi:hypothetical protein